MYSLQTKIAHGHIFEYVQLNVYLSTKFIPYFPALMGTTKVANKLKKQTSQKPLRPTETCF